MTNTKYSFEEPSRQPSRRAFIRNGSLFLLATTSGVSLSMAAQESRRQRSIDQGKAKPKLRLGLITDLHYADKDPAGSRHYRESIAKLDEAGQQFQTDQPEFVVALGDIIDAADSIETELAYLQKIHKSLDSLPGKKHYVLGNHCVSGLTKTEFLTGVGQQKSFYSFDSGGYHFVILDSCFRNDGQPYGRNNFDWTDANIPADQIQWLEEDLSSTKLKSIVFAHQRLDKSESHSVKNAADVRSVLEKSEKVLAVFQGHSHQNSHQEISGIHYCVLTAMVEGTGVENNGYSLVDILDDDVIRLTGFRKQANYRW